MKRHRLFCAETTGFTLIELLIVIAIILILIAIALPNFIEAQIRSKMAHVKSEFRTIETALMAYRQQNPRYPFAESTGVAPYKRHHGYPEGPRIRFTLELTTPVKFLPSVEFIDPFIGSGAVSDQHGDHEYSYYFLNYETFALLRPSPPNTFEGWALCSWAVDTYDSGCSWLPQIVVNAKKQGIPIDPGAYITIYSPTNGIRSRGDIAKYGGFVPSEAKQFDR
jgi:prepilin-type N-terminal cleavage/methylation domain-containing protein